MKMNNPEKYYEVTMNNKPSALIREFFINNYNQKLQGNVAIDLGCGTGNDIAFLLDKGFKVTAIDQEEQVKEFIKNKDLNVENLKIIIDDFSKIEISNSDLLLENIYCREERKMKDKVLFFIIGLLVGAIITSSGFLIYLKY